jgi:DNA-binding response OmpR family regulator
VNGVQTPPAARPRVLLVEDDAALRKLVALVLEVLDIELVSCANGADGLAELRAAPVHVLITDLMMPGLSGYDLLQALADAPALRGTARVLVCSAGLDARARARLALLGAWRMLDKPVSVQVLEDCVREALRLSALDASAPEPASGVGEHDEAGAEQAVISQYFAGQTALFAAYRADCLLQFAHDLQTGDRALAARDAPAVQRLAHNLKSVLRMLGREAAAAQAQALEAAAARADWGEMAPGWDGLRRQLTRWALPAPPPVPG